MMLFSKNFKSISKEDLEKFYFEVLWILYYFQAALRNLTSAEKILDFDIRLQEDKGQTKRGQDLNLSIYFYQHNCQIWYNS